MIELLDIKNKLKFNKNDYDDLNNASISLDKEITGFYLNLTNYYDKYKKFAKDNLLELFKINAKRLFRLDFSLPTIPEKAIKSEISYQRMNRDSENLSVPIINVDSEGKSLICCYKSLELNLSKICPAFYCKPFVINIISFIKEDVMLKIKSYKGNKIYIKNEKEKFEKKVEEGDIDEKKRRWGKKRGRY